MLNGYTTNLPTDTLLNMGILERTISAVSTKIGVTAGAPDFDPGIDLRDIEFDGKRYRLKGLTRRVGFKPVMKGTLIEFGSATTGKQIQLLEPGSSTNTVTGTETITPKPTGALYAAGDYVTDLRWIFDRAGGGYACIYFPFALCTKWSLKGQDKQEAQVSFEFEAVGDPAAGLDIAPYLIELRTALPA